VYKASYNNIIRHIIETVSFNLCTVA